MPTPTGEKITYLKGNKIMNAYFVKHPRNFGNEFSLCWIDSGDKEGIEQLERLGWDRITRKKAYSYVSQEKYARKTDPSFAYYGDTTIFPHWFFTESNWESIGFNPFNPFVVEREIYDEESGKLKYRRKTLHTDDGILYYHVQKGERK